MFARFLINGPSFHPEFSNRQDPIWTRERKSKYFIKRYSSGGKYEQFCLNSVSSYILRFFFLFFFWKRKTISMNFPFFLFFGHSMMRELKEETGGMVIMAYRIFKLAYDKFRVQSEVNLLGKMLYRSIEINFTRYRITLHRIMLL